LGSIIPCYYVEYMYVHCTIYKWGSTLDHDNTGTTEGLSFKFLQS
jgi:hypothetical protein